MAIDRYEYYYALLRDFPDLQFTINGGITSIEEVSIANLYGVDMYKFVNKCF